MKHQQLNFLYGNKGAIFTIDILVAMTVFFIAFAVSTYYVSQSAENNLAEIQMVTSASDLLAVMDNIGTLKTLNSTLIENQKNELLPAAYEMRILIQTSENEIVDTGGVAPEGSFTATGKRYFSLGMDSAEAKYWIWRKE